MSSLTDLIREAVRVQMEKRAASSPSVLYGQCISTSANGLATIQLDGATTPSADLPTLSRVAVGDRVMLHLQHKHLVILGAIQTDNVDEVYIGSGMPPESAVLWIDTAGG